MSETANTLCLKTPPCSLSSRSWPPSALSIHGREPRRRRGVLVITAQLCGNGSFLPEKRYSRKIEMRKPYPILTEIQKQVLDTVPGSWANAVDTPRSEEQKSELQSLM